MSTEETCFVCGEPPTERYDDGTLTVVCPNGHFTLKNFVPPGAADGRSFDALVSLASTLSHQQSELFREGTCPRCYGQIETTIAERDGPVRFPFVSECGGCGMRFSGPLGLYLSRHPAVVAHHYERGADVTTTPLWRLDIYDADVSRVERGFRFELHDLALTLTPDGNVCEVE